MLLLGLVAAWQLRRYSAVGQAGSGGIDPVLVVAPALLLAGCALIPLRLLPALIRLTERLADRGRRLAAALAGWEIGRRPLRQTGPALLAILAVAMGTLALAQLQSWHRSGSDQAAYAVGADVRADRAAALPLGQAALISRARGVTAAMAVSSFNGGTGGGVLAVDARRAAATVLMRADQSPERPGTLWRTITPHGAAAGLAIPGRPARLVLSARLSKAPRSAGLGPLTVTMAVQDASGAVYQVPAGQLAPDGAARLLTARLAPGGTAAAYPLRLLGVTWSYQLPEVPKAKPARRAAAQRQLTLTIGGLSAAGPHGRVPAPFAAGTALARWQASAGSPFLAQSSESGAVGTAPGLRRSGAGPGGSQQLVLRPGYGELPPEYPGYPALPVSGAVQLTALPVPAVLPGIATRAFLAASHATPGAIVSVTASGLTMLVRVAAVLKSFPTAGSGGVLIVDLGTLERAVAAGSAPPLPVTSWWLRTTAGQVPAGLPPGTAVTSQAHVAAALLRAPLAALPLRAAVAAGAAAAVLAMLGFAISVAASLRERRSRSALLAALGVSRGAQAAQLCLEQLLLAVPAAAGGLVLGALAARLLIPAVTLTDQATAPVPPVLVVLPLGWAAGLAVAVAALPVLAAAATVAHRPDPAAELRAAELA